jgi:MerR family transcriptional regulator, light-induced transcriptional regulator
MNTFTIKDLENLSGIKAHTIRIWEQRYSFLKPERTGTNIRFYSNNELKTVMNIALLNKFGYKISHIDKMTGEEIKDRLLSLNQVQAQQERIVNELIESMIDLDIDKFELILGNYIIARGIERSISQIIFPFLEKIGILWLTSHINPAQEHLVSNIIRQKLIVGIESVVSSVDLKKTILLFLPEGEYHELGLLFLYYILKSRGAKVVYLGANVPLDDVEYVAKLKTPDFLFSHLTTVGHNFSFDRFITNITKKFSGIPIIISGQLTHTFEKKIPPSINFKKSFQEVMEFVGSL